MADAISLTVNGRPVSVPRGATVAAAIAIAGETRVRTSVRGAPRGPLCGSLAQLSQPLLDIGCALANTLGITAQGDVHIGQAAMGVGSGAQ